MGHSAYNSVYGPSSFRAYAKPHSHKVPYSVRETIRDISAFKNHTVSSIMLHVKRKQLFKFFLTKNYSKPYFPYIEWTQNVLTSLLAE
jgi:hypothetical protein